MKSSPTVSSSVFEVDEECPGIVTYHEGEFALLFLSRDSGREWAGPVLLVRCVSGEPAVLLGRSWFRKSTNFFSDDRNL